MCRLRRNQRKTIIFIIIFHGQVILAYKVGWWLCCGNFEKAGDLVKGCKELIKASKTTK